MHVWLTHPLLVPPAAPEPGYSEPFTVNSTGVQFYINTTYGSFVEAEENCQFNGGHLATYTDITEQVTRLCPPRHDSLLSQCQCTCDGQCSALNNVLARPMLACLL